MATKKAPSEKSTQAVASATPPASTSPAEGLPIFYKQPAMLDKDRHAKAAVNPQVNFAFARNTNSLALTLPEFVEAVKFYPIVFTDHDVPLPIAILGLEKENYFVDRDGQWKADTYVPAYARQYPFIFFEQPEESKFYLCIDEGAPHFRAEGGEGLISLFNDDGTPSELTNNALQFCSAYYQDHAVTRAFSTDMKAHNLFSPYRWDMQFPTGKRVSLSQFYMIDENAFNALSEEVFLDFRKKGWLPFIYLAFAAASNWRRLTEYGQALGIDK